MPTTRYSVVLEEMGGKRYKLCRVLLSTDGSYMVTCPYHKGERVFLSKMVVNYKDPNKRRTEPPMERALLDDDDHRLKLSHHPDGFVQFSGEGILSGRNADGSPKGIGLQSWPLTHPTAGPACGVTIQTPKAFEEAERSSRNEILYRVSDLYRSAEDNGLVIEMYYFPANYRRFVRQSASGFVIPIRHPSGSVLDLRVCKSPPDDWKIGFLGIDLWPCPVQLGDKSGFAISSPTGNLKYNADNELEGEAIFATYPPLTDKTSAGMVNLAFRPRDDPPYTKGDQSPSADDIVRP